MVVITVGTTVAIIPTTVTVIPITEDLTGPDIITDGMRDITTDQAAIILKPTIVIDMVILIAGTPTDIHIDPERPQVASRDPLLVIPGTEAVPRHR